MVAGLPGEGFTTGGLAVVQRATGLVLPGAPYNGGGFVEAGLPEEAEVIYWEDLRRNPNNGYSLFGLAQSLKAEGDTDTLAQINRRFALAWQYADVKLTSSRY